MNFIVNRYQCVFCNQFNISKSVNMPSLFGTAHIYEAICIGPFLDFWHPNISDLVAKLLEVPHLDVLLNLQEPKSKVTLA